jgi:hypothetical protein
MAWPEVIFEEKPFVSAFHRIQNLRALITM